jgi:hypothetical protein
LSLLIGVGLVTNGDPIGKGFVLSLLVRVGFVTSGESIG